MTSNYLLNGRRAAVAAVIAAALVMPDVATAQRGGPITQPITPNTATTQIAKGTVEVPRGSLAIRNLDALWTATGEVHRNVNLVLRDGIIRAVGPDVAIPSGIPVIDGQGMTAIPGLIDTHSHTALVGTNEGSSPVVPEVRVVDALRTDDIQMYQALSGGVTTATILHGSSNPIGGQSATIKTRWGMDHPWQLLIEDAPRTVKFALGENVTRKSFSGQGVRRFPGSREGVETVYVQAFTAAQQYKAAWEEYRRNPSSFAVPPRRDLRLEALVDIMEGRIKVIAHSYRSDEIVMLMEVAERFGFKIDLFTHILEGYKVANELVEHGAAASTFSDWWQYKLEAFDAIPYNAAVMHNQGVLTTLNSDIPWLQGTMVMELSKPVKYGGVSKEEALRMLTAYAAQQLHLEDRIGTIEVGKDADVVLLNGDPFDSYTRVEKTIVDGIVYYDRTREAELRGQPVRPWVASALASESSGSSPAPARSRGRPQGDGMEEGALVTREAAAMSRAPIAPVANRAVTAFVGATVHPVSGPAIQNGVIVVQDRQILAVGAAGNVQVPAGATQVNLAGKHIYPGMIEPMTQLGMVEIESYDAARDDREIGSFNPHVNSLWGVHPHSEAIPVARANGITAVMAAPSSGPVAGAGVVVQLAGDTPPQMAVKERATLVVELPRGTGQAWDPATLDGAQLEEVVKLFERSKLFAEGDVTYDDPTDPFEVNVDGGSRILLEAMVPFVTGERPVLFKARTEREIRTVLLLLDEYPAVRGVIVGGDQAFRVADELARRQVPVLVGSMLTPTEDRDDPITAGWENAARLHQAGVKVSFTTQYVPNTTDVRNLPYHAARAVAYGLPEEMALRAVTLSAAEILGVSDVMGSLEPGKRADFIVTDGDPLQIVTQVERVWIGGEEQSMETRHTRLYEAFRGR